MRKLNLGGGKVQIPGFLNVDLDEAADLKHDLLLPLPFPDKSIDEIMAIHVIESFYKWEFPVVLKDWCRVLVPGGKLTIEFTELAAAIKLYQEGEIHGKWGLYGNQDEKWPGRVYHHYVYEVEELKKLLTSCCRWFTSIRFTKEGVAHWPPRDWRVICS